MACSGLFRACKSIPMVLPTSTTRTTRTSPICVTTSASAHPTPGRQTASPISTLPEWRAYAVRSRSASSQWRPMHHGAQSFRVAWTRSPVSRCPRQPSRSWIGRWVRQLPGNALSKVVAMPPGTAGFPAGSGKLPDHPEVRHRLG
jgi:hypothetical protein